MGPIDPQSCSNAMTSQLLGCSGNTLGILAGKGIVPREQRGRYDLFKVVPAFIAHRKGENEVTREEVIAKRKFLDARIRQLRLASDKTAARLIETESTRHIYREFADVVSMLATEIIVRNADLAVAMSKASDPLQIRNILGAQIALVMNTIQEALDLDD